MQDVATAAWRRLSDHSGRRPARLVSTWPGYKSRHPTVWKSAMEPA